VTLASMELAARLFGEAWEHRRRRHRILRTSLLVGLITAAVAGGALVGRQQANPAGSGLRREVASRVVARSDTSLTPDQQLGDHCAVVNSVACDTLTLQLQLTRPAKSVVASMASRTVRLTATPRTDGFPVPAEITLTRSFAPWTAFSGELFPAGASRPVAHPRSQWGGRDHRGSYVNVRLLITYPDGQKVNTTVRVTPLRVYEGGGPGLANPSPRSLSGVLQAAQRAAADQAAKSVG
jgi:hypothetical protein